MHDAVRIDFVTNQRDGVGTEFHCATRIEPFRTRDLMTITEWIDGATMGVRHQGLITGEGRFVLSRVEGATRVEWREVLHFPWWLGGTIGATIAKPVLRFVWRRNLELLVRRLSG